jgi:hypothetical protein
MTERPGKSLTLSLFRTKEEGMRDVKQKWCSNDRFKVLPSYNYEENTQDLNFFSTSRK